MFDAVRWNVGQQTISQNSIQEKFDYFVVTKTKSKSREIYFSTLVELALTMPLHWMIKQKNNAKGNIYRSDFVDSRNKEKQKKCDRQRDTERVNRKYVKQNSNCVRKRFVCPLQWAQLQYTGQRNSSTNNGKGK